ncbi:hypothetical protein A2U01_0091208, partial [Trifolium medium]|nr:hypothetical protein [Trifolium medium]
VKGLKWWEDALKATGLYGLANTGYSRLEMAWGDNQLPYAERGDDSDTG